MKKNKVSKNWIYKHKKDIYVRKSKVEGYRSRAVYKLQEINNKFKVLKNGFFIIDLGAAPGSWSQYLAEKIKNGKIISIDLLKFEPIENTTQIVGDFNKDEYKIMIKDFFKKKIDLVISDMAVNTTGNKNLDSMVTGELCLEAMSFSLDNLNKNGCFISKIFMGSNFNEIVADAKKSFMQVKIFKPLASRKDSKENFLICKILR